MDWDDLKYFLAVAKTGSIRGASQKLRVNHSTVSRRIKSYEQELGQQLFIRNQTGYAMTTAAEEIYEVARNMEEQINALERTTFSRDDQLSGEIRITMPHVLSSHLLMPILSQFTIAYPGIELDLDISPETLNLTNREADVAIRITNDPPDHLIGKKVARYAKSIYASPEYITSHNFKDKASLNWIGWDDTSTGLWWVMETDFSDVPLRHKMNNEYAQLEAAKVGMGMTMLPCFIGDAVAGLQRVQTETILPSYEIWILTHPDLRNSARVSVFIKFMAEALEQKRDLLEGRSPVTTLVTG